MLEYNLEVNNVDIPWSLLHWKRTAIFGSDIVEAVVPGIATIVGGQSIRIKENGVTKGYGRIKDYKYLRGKGGVSTKIIGASLEKEAYDNLEFQWGRIFIGQPQAVIFNDINNVLTDLSIGTLDAFGSTRAFEWGSDYDTRWNIYDVWNRICLVIGWEIYVAPLGVVDFKAACGVDRGKTPVGVPTTKFEYGENMLTWIAPHRVDETLFAGEVIVVGRKEGNHQAFGTYGAGTPTRKFFFKDLHNPLVCDDAAENIHDDISNAIISGKFSAIDEGLTYDVMDTVQIKDDGFGIDTDYRVYEIEKWVSLEKVLANIRYTNLTHITGNGPLLMDRGKGGLLAGQQALRAIHMNPYSMQDVARQFSYSGESADGYRIQLGGTGGATLHKDYLTLNTGVNPGSSTIDSPDSNIDFSSEFDLDFRFKISNHLDATAEREFMIGTFDWGSKGIWFYLNGFDLDAITYNGAGLFTKSNIMKPISKLTWYRCSAYKRGNKVYFRFNGWLTAIHTTNIPTTGMGKSLLADHRCNPNANHRDYTLWIDDYKQHTKYVDQL